MKWRTTTRPYNNRSLEFRLRTMAFSEGLPSGFLYNEAAAVEESWTQTTVPRAALIDILKTHNLDLHNEGGAKLAERLRDPRSLVVITGQQPGLLGGAMLVAIKLAAAVRIAQNLEKRLDRPVIPIFWNHSEDHDLAEANTFTSIDGVETKHWKLPIPDEGRALEKIAYDAAAITHLKEIADAVGAPEIILPNEGESFGRVFSRQLLHLLRDFPVVHCEPYRLRSLLSSFHADAVSQAGDWNAAITQQTSLLGAAGVSAQVKVDQGEFLFLLDERGVRRRLRREGNQYQCGSLHFSSMQEILSWLRDHPEQVSCNVFARPLALQRVFPIVAHVNGPGESAYFAQLHPAFAKSGSQAPLNALRPSLTVLREKELKLLADQQGETFEPMIPVSEWPPPSADLTTPIPLDSIRPSIDQGLENLKNWAGVEGRGIVTPFVQKTLEGLERACLAVAKQKDQESKAARRQRRHLENWIWPDRALQERVLGPFALFRDRAPLLLQKVLRAMDLFAEGHQVVQLEDQDMESLA